MNMKNSAGLLAFATLLMYGSMASATIISYTDHATWLAAAGTIDGGEDFSSFTSDTSFDGASLALSDGMSIGTIGADGRGLWNIVDVEPLTSEGNVDDSEFAYLLGGPFGSSGSVTPFITFSGGVSAFGADFRNLNDVRVRTIIDVFDGATLLASFMPAALPFDNLRFFGLYADAGETISELRFRWLSPDAYGMDNIEIARVAVPEPGTLALLALGLLGIASRRRMLPARCTQS